MVVVMYVRCPLSLRNVGNLLLDRGVDIYREADARLIVRNAEAGARYSASFTLAVGRT